MRSLETVAGLRPDAERWRRVPARPRNTPRPRLSAVPELELEGGRRLTYERSFWSEPEVKLKRGFWTSSWI